jgi:DNA-binding PucR family transcriptional regulator
MGMGQAELAAVRLGISAEQIRVAAVNVWPPPAAAPDTLQSRLRLFEILRTACSVRIPGAVCGLADNTAYILLPQTTEASFAFQRQAILGIIRSSTRLLSGSILVGIGRPATIRELSQSRTDADHVLAELLRNVEEGRVEPDTEEAIADHESLGPRLHLRQIVRELHGGSELPGVFVSKVVTHDAEKGTRFEETLRVYLECGGNAIITAKRMGVHVNTVRYRLSRIAPLFALDLDDPDTRLLLWLQLWARHNG